MPKTSNRGFTFVEIISVLVLIGVLTAVAVSYFNISTHRVQSVTEEIKSHLRYAQTCSMNSNVVYGVYFIDDTHYTLFRDGDITKMIIPPGNDNMIVNLGSQGISLSGLGTGIVSFDSLGRPCSNANGNTLQAAIRTITVTDGTGTEIIQITKNTGYIP